MSRHLFEAEHLRPLLPDANLDVDLEDEKCTADRPMLRHASWLRRQPLIFVSALLVLSVLVNLGQAWSVRWAPGRSPTPTVGIRLDESYSPAYGAVEYELRKFNRARWVTPWHGPPSGAVDDAWKALYNFGVSKIPKSDAAKMLNRTVAIPGDEDNYVIALDVFHQLHCLNMIRQALSPDYYHMPRIVDGFDHADHCVNSLRESLMCSVDITPNTWIWNPTLMNGTGKTQPRLDNMHMCRNFDKVRDWAKARPVDGRLDTSVHVEDELEYEIIY